MLNRGVEEISSQVPEVFASQLAFSTSSFEEAANVLQKHFTYQRQPIDVEQLFLDDDLSISTGSNSFRMTEPAFEMLCDITRVPTDFAKGIPIDLARTILMRLRVLHQQSVVLIHRGGTVVAFVDPMKWTRSRAKFARPHFDPVPNGTLLKLVKETHRSISEPVRIHIEDSGMQMELLSETTALEPEVGDITRVGLTIASSETGGLLPVARVYTLRLQCTNGAVAPRTYGELRFNSDYRVSMERRLNAFRDGLTSFAADADMLLKGYEWLVNARLLDVEFYDLFRRLKHVYRIDSNPAGAAEKAMGILIETRQRICREVRDRQERLRKARLPADLAAIPTDFRTWNIFNAITATARDEASHSRRLSLQRIAGDLLPHFSKN